MNGRPRLPIDNERLARRRAQYRNAKRKQRGLPPEHITAAKAPAGSRPVSVLVGTTWVPALIDPDGRRVFLT
jgi:hypothetical protein